MRFQLPAAIAAAAIMLTAAPVSAQQAGDSALPAVPPAAVPTPPRAAEDRVETVPTPAATPGAARQRPASSSPEGPARGAPVNGVLVLYGNERCPTNANGEEIVVCVRRSAQELYRIPKELRDFEVTPENQAWAAREKSIQDVGATGVGTCSTVGAAGQTGCIVQNARRAKAETRAREREANPDLSPY